MTGKQPRHCRTNYFEPDLSILQPMKDKDKNQNTMTLYIDFSFYDPDGKRWHVPKGEPTDGASIPKVLWTVLGHPFDPDFINAAIIHDHFCREADKSDTRELRDKLRKEADVMFYYACKADGCSRVKAFSMFKGVRIGASMPWTPGQRTETIENEDVRVLYSKLGKQKNIFEDDAGLHQSGQSQQQIGSSKRSKSARDTKPSVAVQSVDIEIGIDALDKAIEMEASKLHLYQQRMIDS
jgi:hypothetical protein